MTMETPYKKAWENFTSTPEYMKLSQAVVMSTKPIPLKYFSNIVRTAFDAGWNAAADVANKNESDKSK